MSDTDFSPFTIVAGLAFGCGLVWVLTQWLKADAASDSMERELTHRFANLDATAREGARLAEPASPPRSPEDLALDAEERLLGKLLFWWGLVGLMGGMAAGAFVYRFVGALLGGIGGSLVACVGVVIAVSVRSTSKVSVELPAPTDAAEAAAPEKWAESEDPYAFPPSHPKAPGARA